MLDSLSTSFNCIVVCSLTIFDDIISPQQLAHRFGWCNYGDARVDGCCD